MSKTDAAAQAAFAELAELPVQDRFKRAWVAAIVAAIREYDVPAPQWVVPDGTASPPIAALNGEGLWREGAGVQPGPRRPIKKGDKVRCIAQPEPPAISETVVGDVYEAITDEVLHHSGPGVFDIMVRNTQKGTMVQCTVRAQRFELVVEETTHSRVDLWAAINRYASAREEAERTGLGSRMDAVAKVEREIDVLINHDAEAFDMATASMRMAWDEAKQLREKLGEMTETAMREHDRVAVLEGQVAEANARAALLEQRCADAEARRDDSTRAAQRALAAREVVAQESVVVANLREQIATLTSAQAQQISVAGRKVIEAALFWYASGPSDTAVTGLCNAIHALKTGGSK